MLAAPPGPVARAKLLPFPDDMPSRAEVRALARDRSSHLSSLPEEILAVVVDFLVWNTPTYVRYCSYTDTFGWAVRLRMALFPMFASNPRSMCALRPIPQSQ